MTVCSFDHVAIPIRKVDAMLSFYRALGFTISDNSAPFYSVHFGDQKINFHGPPAWQDERFTLRGPTARPGCGDFCFVWEESLAALQELMNKSAIKVIEGPVQRLGGRDGGRIEGISLYIRDPDENLVEFIVYR